MRGYSTAEAEDNYLSARELAWRDVQNSSATSNSGFGVGFGVHLGSAETEAGKDVAARYPGTLTPIVNMPAREGGSGTTRATVTPGTLELSDQRQDLASLNRDAGAAHVSVEAYDIARLKARQEGAAALSELLNGLTGDLSAEIGLKDGDPAKAALHAAAGAAVAAVAGTDIGTGAAAGLAQELIGAAVNDVLMSNPQLTQAQRNALSQWAAAALGSVIGGASGAAAALDADRFNRQLHMAEADLIRANAARYAVEQGYCESIAACDEGTVGRAAGELTLQALRQTDLTGENLPHNQAAAAFLAGIAPRGLIPGLCAPGSALCQQRWFEAVLYDEYKDSTINRQFFAYASDLYRLASNFYNQHHLTPDDLGYRLGQTVQGIDSIRQVMANGDRTMLPWELFTALAGGFGGPFAARLKAPKPQSPGTVATGGQGTPSPKETPKPPEFGGVDAFLGSQAASLNKKLGTKIGEGRLPYEASRAGVEQAKLTVKETLENATAVSNLIPKSSVRGGYDLIHFYSSKTNSTVSLRVLPGGGYEFDTLIPEKSSKF